MMRAVFVCALFILLAVAVHSADARRNGWLRNGKSNHDLSFREKSGNKPASFAMTTSDRGTLQIDLDEAESDSVSVYTVDGSQQFRRYRGGKSGPRIFRGRVRGDSNSTVTAVVGTDGSVSATVDVNGQEYFVAPPDGESNPDHVVFTREDLKSDATKVCGAVRNDRRRRRRNNNNNTPDKSSGVVVETETPEFLTSSKRMGIKDTKGNFRARRATCGSACQADVAVDVDYEYFLSRGSNVDRVTADVRAVFDAVNNQYQRDVGIRHRLTSIVVRTTPNDPYTSIDAVTMLNELEAVWAAIDLRNPARDHVQLFTGKEVNGSTIGIAWLSSMCRDYGYSVVQSDFLNNGQIFPYASDLSAHELGHAWGAQHCTCTSSTMNPYITGANSFESTARNSITSTRNRATCLDSFTTTTTVATTAVPSTVPSTIPSTIPSTVPSTIPSTVPSTIPSTVPSTIPSAIPSTVPSTIPSTIPSTVPSTPSTPSTTALPVTPSTATPATTALPVTPSTVTPATTALPVTPSTATPATTALPVTPSTATPATTARPTTRPPTTAAPRCQARNSLCFRRSDCCSGLCSWFLCR